MKRKIIHIVVFFASLLSLNQVHAQAWTSFGSTVGLELKQNNASYESAFSPDVELGFRWPTTVGFGAVVDLRWINTEKIEWFSDYKFIWDVYVGPSFFFRFGDDYRTGILLNTFFGYSTSGAWFDPDVSSGSFSIKLSADLVIKGVMIGAFWYPLKQHVEGNSSSSKYGGYMRFGEFDMPSRFGLRIGYVFSFG